MKNTNLAVRGSKGESSQQVYYPVEAENSLRATTTASILDAICEGPIYGPANDDNWAKSTYFNETQVMDDDGNWNFEGVTIAGRTGTIDQEYIPGQDKIRAAQSVGVAVTYDGGPVARTVTSSSITDVAVSIEVPQIWSRASNGDTNETGVDWKVTVTPDNGTGTEQTAIEDTVYGKCVSTYRRQKTITDISQYGSAPWVIKVYRMTADSTSSSLVNAFSWYSYTEITDVKIRYSHTAVAGVTFNAELFGGSVPNRCYHLKLRLIKYPSNYDPDARTYTGIWDGTFSTGYCNNPAWVAYDICTELRAAIGLDEDFVDKAWLYTAGQYCDENVTFTQRTRNSDGTFTATEVTEPRFTFNGLIQTQTQAIKAVQTIFSTFMAFPIWTTGQISGAQDSERDPDYTADPTDVKDGLFTYSGTGGLSRTSVAVITYNDMDNFCRTNTIVQEDQDALARYGYIKRELTAVGCTSPSEAARRAAYTIYSDQQLTDQVVYTGGLKFSQALPGQIVEIQDPAHSGKVLYGRVTASTTTSITANWDITIESGVTYTLKVASGTEVALYERELTNSAGTTDTLTWTTALPAAPTVGYSFVLAVSSSSPRQFEIMNNKEIDGVEYEITGVEYHSTKYAEIETGLVVDGPSIPVMTSGKLTPPGTPEIKRYSYTEGDQGLRKYGLIISWEASGDPRALSYEVIVSFDSGAWYSAGPATGLQTYTLRDIVSGDYDIGVRAVSATGQSNYVYAATYTFTGELNPPAEPTGLVCTDSGSTTFSGPGCEIEWTASVGSTFTDDDGAVSVGTSNVRGYLIEVYDGLTLLRSYETDGPESLTYVYTLEMNVQDNSGTPTRNVNFKVYTVDSLGVGSSAAATLSASNPAPDMSSITPTILDMPGYLDISWAWPTDNDLAYVHVMVDGALWEIVSYPGNSSRYTDVEYGTNYSIQIVPYDEFGVGTASQSATGTPEKIPGVNVAVEVSGSITMSDSDGNTTATLAALYDNARTTGGVGYTVSGTDKYIQYLYGIEDYFNRISVWMADDNARVYAATSTDGTTWSYFKADTDHTVDSGALTLASSQSDAQTNYWQLSDGLNVALLPGQVIAKYVRLYITGTYSTTIYEFVPARITISELAAIVSLSAYSADLGAIKAGVISNGASSSVTAPDLTVGTGMSFSDGVLTKTGATAAWDAQAYSDESYTGGASVRFVADQEDAAIVIGLDQSPTDDAGYTSIDYGLYLSSSGAVGVMESGSFSPSGTYAAGDVFEVRYDGTNIDYLQNWVVFRQVTVSITNPLYMDSSFYTQNGSVSVVRFSTYPTQGYMESNYNSLYHGVWDPNGQLRWKAGKLS